MCVVQVELEEIRDRIHKELVTRYHMCSSFTNAHEDTMRKMLDYIEDRYVTHLSRFLFLCSRADRHIWVALDLLPRCYFNPFKPSGVKWLHFEVSRAILV